MFNPPKMRILAAGIPLGLWVCQLARKYQNLAYWLPGALPRHIPKQRLCVS